MLPQDLENILLQITLDPTSYRASKKRARVQRPRYDVDGDVSRLHRKFRCYMAQHTS